MASSGPATARSAPDGALYIVYWGEIAIAAEQGCIRIPEGSGTLWRIRSTADAGAATPTGPPVRPGAQVPAGLGVLPLRPSVRLAGPIRRCPPPARRTDAACRLKLRDDT
jgi:hypothetical protein